MPLAKSLSISLFGLQGRLIEVEADISSNLPGFALVGLPDTSLQEASARVRAACVNSGLPWPERKITVNLSPASVPKAGSGFDLAIAASIMAAQGALPAADLSGVVLLGELTLDGAVRGVRGVLPAVQAARQLGVRRVVVPVINLPEAQVVEGIEAIAVASLADFASHFGFRGQLRYPSSPVEGDSLAGGGAPEGSGGGAVGGGADDAGGSSAGANSAANSFTELDYLDVLGQEEAIYAMAVAAVGGHHALLIGPPGAGKTMLAERLPTILPQLATSTAIELAAVKSLIGLGSAISDTPPFVAPHHGVSQAGLIGGGTGIPKPGLISQAHGGVLFLDEAPEFAAQALDALREPLESGTIAIARSGGVASFPARSQLILAANPCPCGYRGVRGKDCTCAYTARSRYASRLSGPLLDRIDIRLRVEPATKTAKVKARRDKERPDSQAWRERVIAARALTAQRLADTPWQLNSQVTGAHLRKLNARFDNETSLLERAVVSGAISMRGYDRCLRLAWSVADLNGDERITEAAVAKAVFLRGREMWADA